ncbi:2-oxo-4-hydroxy-4-carboxy-5-ureidoimidazoline decarboxylase [Nocardia farcinica]|uniref:2-oxo-4-hydroxy-4-carboxy-5-ureidoimidazoline decarboxylase n=1 Tax=Nocardia farcinica TaxID=37329 RepID=UPI001893D299|nr:2-oxo-4-hydroxy-4-carboxy-5-ureidoimidazoline decarboxylase [Nocardia farcinica]MBF6071150.1 2-oxo-4-hydroxy-4-carboxy-5-ureidoimidazoline decarboxylase [Nocardia farcinica]
MTHPAPAGTAAFDALSAAAATAVLLEVCASPEWARRVVAGRPYGTAERLYAAAERVLADLPEREIDRALAGHPRIGEQPGGAASSHEQAGVAGADAATRAALAAGNRAYERRFGRIYLVSAAGRSADELLAILEARLRNDPEVEKRVVREELAKINRLRLARLPAVTGEDPV